MDLARAKPGPTYYVPPSVLVKPADGDCNLACEYCFYRDKPALWPHARRRMTLEVAEAMIRQHMAVGHPQVSFCWQGGEPTLMGLDFFKRVVELQFRYAQPGQLVANSLQTNGVLIDEKWARFLAEARFLVGLSVDLPPSAHDHYRRDHAGRPTFERCVRAAEVLAEHGVEFNILLMVTPRSVRHAARIWDELMARGWRFAQCIPCVEPGKGGGVAHFTVDPHDYGTFLCELFDRWAATLEGTISLRTFDDFLMKALTGQNPTCIFRPLCGDYYVVEHNGEVYTCDFFVEPQWLLGNILEQPIEKILQSEKWQQFRRRKQQLAEECRSCKWLDWCWGGCVKHRLVAGGVDRPSYLCPGYKKFFEHAMGRLEEIAAWLRARRALG